ADHLIRVLNPLEVVALVACLTARPSPQGATQAPRRRRLCIAIPRRRPGGVARILAQPGTQLGHLALKLNYSPPELLDDLGLANHKRGKLLIARTPRTRVHISQVRVGQQMPSPGPEQSLIDGGYAPLGVTRS